MLDTLASRDAEQGPHRADESLGGWAGVTPKASFSPKKQTCCSSVRVCPGDLGAPSMGKPSRAPQQGSMRAFRVVVGAVVVTVMWGFNPKADSLVAVWGHVCSRPGSPQSACSPGQGAVVGRRRDSRTAWRFCLFQQDCGSSVWTEEQGNHKSFAEVVRVKLRGRLWTSALL